MPVAVVPCGQTYTSGKARALARRLMSSFANLQNNIGHATYKTTQFVGRQQQQHRNISPKTRNRLSFHFHLNSCSHCRLDRSIRLRRGTTTLCVPKAKSTSKKFKSSSSLLDSESEVLCANAIASRTFLKSRLRMVTSIYG